jgi:hypothetical protein
MEASSVRFGIPAISASPIFRAFGDDQIDLWVTRSPYAWMP